MKLDKRTTTVLGIAVIAILLLLSGFFIVNPSITAQKEMSAELETAKQRSADYQAQIVALEAVKENIGMYEEQDAELTTKFPSQADIELLLNDITKAGNDSGVSEITTIQTGVPEVVIAEPGAEAAPAEEAPAEGEAAAPAEGEVPSDPAAAAEPQGSDLAIMSLNLTAEGSEKSLRDYATALTEMPRSFLIESISITCDGGCTLTASGTTYLYRPTVSPEEEQPEGEAVEEAPVEEAPVEEAPITEG